MITNPGDSIMWDRIAASLERRARAALTETADWLVMRAQERAPVRDIFPHGRGRTEHVPRGLKYDRAGNVARDSHGKAIFQRRKHHAESTRAKFLEQVNRQREFQHQAVIEFGQNVPLRHPRSANNSLADSPTKKLTQGNNRGYAPLMQKNGVTIHGSDVRTISHATKEGPRVLESLPGISVFTRQKVINSKGRDAQGRNVPLRLTDLVGARGRFELKRAGQLYKELVDKGQSGQFGRELQRKGYGVRQIIRKDEKGNKSYSGELTLGGRLRDSIKRDEAIRDSRGLLRVEVYVDTDEVSYGRFQEYGTSHNKAHPFMRPALYEAKPVFVRNLKKVLARGTA